ncbi:MAG: alpha-aminoadipate/glutamate carrier protein LysW/ArgW [Zestosphaera sp.]
MKTQVGVQAMMAKCPVCGGEVNVPDDALPGELVEHECGITLEVVVDGDLVGLKPLEGVREDWGE